MDIKNKSIKELQELSQQIRNRILEVVSKNGGHLSSTLGAVELIVAMHYVFDPLNDPFIFDVSHQAYAHKLITDRWDRFDTLRRLGGISGFIKPEESIYDYFIAGHSSTSISLAVGAAKAIALKGENRVPIVLIGDGAMSAGMAYEALNELGERKYPVVIILNDNEMSIAKPIGAISRYLSKLIAGEFYQALKARVDKVIQKMPKSAHYMAKRFEESLLLITPGILFEEMGLEYIGPIDGHNLESLIDTFKQAKRLNKPVIVHCQTLKGKGYEKAEGHFEHWHGVGPFDIESGKILNKQYKKSATEIFSKAIYDLANKNEKVVGLTAAMPSGTGLKRVMEKYPDRFFDVAIAEQHAVTSAAAMAREGLKPFVCIYSTFLQRGFDQIIHDVSVMSLPVVFAIDRAGIVGEDGETHQGIFDVSYLRIIPNLVLFAPRDEFSMIDAVRFASELNMPSAFRYPRGPFSGDCIYPETPFVLGKSELLRDSSSNILFVGYGNGVNRAKMVIDSGFEAALLDLRFLKPLDSEMLLELSKRFNHWFVFSDNIKAGGVASAISEFFMENRVFGIKISSLEFENAHIKHGTIGELEEYLKIDTKSLLARVKELID